MTAIRAALPTVCLAAAQFIGTCCFGAQVPPEWLPHRLATGAYVHPPTVKVRTITLSATGMVCECTRSLPNSRRPLRWREKYAIRRGKPVLIGVFLPHWVAGPPARTVWRDTHQTRDLAAAARPPPPTRIASARTAPARSEMAPLRPPPAPVLDPGVPQDSGPKKFAALSLNPRWTRYGSYLRGFADTAQIEWDRILADDPIRPEASGKVTIAFVLESTGAIRITGTQSDPGISDEAVRDCLRALTVRAPYEPWTEDMVADLGSEQAMTFSFSYY